MPAKPPDPDDEPLDASGYSTILRKAEVPSSIFDELQALHILSRRLDLKRQSTGFKTHATAAPSSYPMVRTLVGHLERCLLQPSF
ncbi:MAG: hypothetical protein VKP57_07980 [Candidatus Sericytochromatia bacterium]|nr:hypothetical protein [Candidatus Sericytochromatia bacterium]